MLRFIQLYRFSIALLLLVCFSATQFPFELFHNHSDVVVCHDYSPGTDVCKHKSHLATKKDHCLACSIHVEKIYLFIHSLVENNGGNSSIPPHFTLAGIRPGTPEHTTLRGPPDYTVYAN
ncbi:MAG: hypothetical protein M9904_09100 [Chitinophagaceae bacterium]|nr:hypothetical protein [Chitinophagaceae bacterium]